MLELLQLPAVTESNYRPTPCSHDYCSATIEYLGYDTQLRHHARERRNCTVYSWTFCSLTCTTRDTATRWTCHVDGVQITVTSY